MQVIFFFLLLLIVFSTQIGTDARADNSTTNMEKKADDVASLKELMECYSEGVDYTINSVWEKSKNIVKYDTGIDNSFKIHFIVEEGGFLGVALKVKEQCDSGFRRKYPTFSGGESVKSLSEIYISELARLDKDFAEKCKSDVKNDSLKEVTIKACNSHQKILKERL